MDSPSIIPLFSEWEPRAIAGDGVCDDESVATFSSRSVSPFGNRDDHNELLDALPIGNPTEEIMTNEPDPHSFDLSELDKGDSPVEHAINQELTTSIPRPGHPNFDIRITGGNGKPHTIPSVSPEYVDNMVAKDLSSLSIEKREQVYFDVHGVSAVEDETPQLLKERLILMDKTLDNLDDVKGEAYRMALELDASYVRDKSFRLQFLRADRLDPQAAAERLARHLTHKLELFGKELLVQNITQDHIDQDVLKEGAIQILSERDSSGRIIMLNTGVANVGSVITRFKVMAYIVMAAARDIESQQRGCIIVSFLVGKGKIEDIQTIHQHNMAAARVLQSMPLRMEALHLCTDDIEWQKSLSMFKLSGSTQNALRIREHVGSYEECLFQLQTFGIPVHNFPMDSKRTMDNTFHLSLIQKLRRFEVLQRESASEMDKDQPCPVAVPGRWDVLCGRGRCYYEYMGNVRLRYMITERAEEYDTSNNKGKTRINSEVVASILTRGRFLEDTQLGWTVVSEKIARRKVAHMFRDDRSQRLVAKLKDDVLQPENTSDAQVAHVTKAKRTRD